MTPSKTSVQPPAKRTVNWPVLKLPPKSEKFGEGMSQEERQAVEQHSHEVKSTLDQHLADMGKMIADLQQKVAVLEAKAKSS